MAKWTIEVRPFGPMPVLVVRSRTGQEATIDPFGVVRGPLRGDLRSRVQKNPASAYEVLAMRVGIYDRQVDAAWRHAVISAWRVYDPDL